MKHGRQTNVKARKHYTHLSLYRFITRMNRQKRQRMSWSD